MRAASMHKIGRKRLPPAKTLCRMARWMTSGRCDSGGSSRSSAASVRTRPSSSVCFNIGKSEYNKRDQAGAGQRGLHSMYPTLMPRGKRVADGAVPAEKLKAPFPRLALRIKRLAAETPSSFLAFDLLVDAAGKLLTRLALSERREELQSFSRFFRKNRNIRLSPASMRLEEAERWMHDYGELGCDGVIAKRL